MNYESGCLPFALALSEGKLCKRNTGFCLKGGCWNTSRADEKKGARSVCFAPVKRIPFPRSPLPVISAVSRRAGAPVQGGCSEDRSLPPKRSSGVTLRQCIRRLKVMCLNAAAAAAAAGCLIDSGCPSGRGGRIDRFHQFLDCEFRCQRSQL